MRILVPSLFIIVGLALAGCSGNATAPTPLDAAPSLVGSWEGTLGGEQFRMEIIEGPDKTLSGEAHLGTGAGALTLTILSVEWNSPTSFTMILLCEEDCLRIMRGSLDSPGQLSGSYTEGPLDSNRTPTNLPWQAVLISE